MKKEFSGNAVEFVEDNFHEIISDNAAHDSFGPLVAAEYIYYVYADQENPPTPELIEIYRSTGGLVVSETLPPDDHETILDKDWRARALLALAGHKVNSRLNYSADEMAEDFRRPFALSSLAHYKEIREEIFEDYRSHLRKTTARSPNQELALDVSGKVSKEYKSTARNVLRAASDAISRSNIDFH